MIVHKSWSKQAKVSRRWQTWEQSLRFCNCKLQARWRTDGTFQTSWFNWYGGWPTKPPGAAPWRAALKPAVTWLCFIQTSTEFLQEKNMYLSTWLWGTHWPRCPWVTVSCQRLVMKMHRGAKLGWQFIFAAVIISVHRNNHSKRDCSSIQEALWASQN